MATKPRSKSYGSILRSSSIVGGAEVIKYGVGLVRTKLIALLLGPSGIGLLGLYNTLQQVLVTFAGGGVSFSAVREIAKEGGGQVSEEATRVILSVRRICLLLGVLGGLLAAVLAIPVSRWVFEDSSKADGVALLGIAVCLLIISGGQKALVQGCRRIGDLARIQISSILLSTLLAVGIYAWLGRDGILPALITTAICNLLITWCFARRIELVHMAVPWGSVIKQAKPLLGLGLAFMWSALLLALIDLFIRSFILRYLGLDSVGVYQAAWAISGLFASFILNAMGADFYPRLTQVQTDHPEMVRLINEQTEIGMLLALPGILGTLALAPWLMTLLYSSEFAVGADLLPWLVLGVFGRVVIWPIGFVFLAKGAKGHFAAIETCGKIIRVLLFVICLERWGLLGVAIAWPLSLCCSYVVIFMSAWRMINYRYDAPCFRLLLISVSIIALSFLARAMLPTPWGFFASIALLLAGSFYSLHALMQRLGPEHRIVRLLKKVPFVT